MISEIRQAPNESVSDSVIMTCSINLSGGDCAESLPQLWNAYLWLQHGCRAKMRTVATHHKIASIILFPSSFFCFLHVADVEAVKIQAEAERKMPVTFCGTLLVWENASWCELPQNWVIQYIQHHKWSTHIAQNRWVPFSVLNLHSRMCCNLTAPDMDTYSVSMHSDLTNDMISTVGKNWWK